MSLLIKGLNIPKNCLLCPCCVGEGIGMGRQHYCQVIDDEPCVSETYRPKNCPLVKVPTPHGRLIDADYINGSGLIEWQKSIVKAEISQAPTVIEAEVSDERL